MSSYKLIVHDVPVLVVGGGPVGMLTATQLAHHGVQCMLAERNLELTKWPKMDITNCRSMELLRRLKLADELRKIALFEAWLKPVIEANPLINCYFGLKFKSLSETSDGVVSLLRDTTTEQYHIVKSKYLVGCDGSGSRVRKASKINLTGGPVPSALYLVHFKSRDLAKLRKQGQFWHIYFTHGGFIISQDEVNTFTAHLLISLDEDVDRFDPKEIVYKVLGGHAGLFHIDIDKIMVNNAWRLNLVVADNYRSKRGCVFPAGDSVHQNIPTGGYGMNTGVADAYDIGWKLAAVLNGYAGEYLLQSYNTERRPVTLRNVERSDLHFSVVTTYIGMASEKGTDVLLSATEEAKFPDSPVVVNDGSEEKEWNPSHYTPSTWPGVRAPHVFLKDGTTSIFDLYGENYTVIDFTADGIISQEFQEAASSIRVPLKRVHLPSEPHVRSVWERGVVLVRPDGFLAGVTVTFRRTIQVVK
ncbi:hypothetical protein B7463_g12365, partial [Scytalidium lignicola]